jgi:hypothetical protein
MSTMVPMRAMVPKEVRRQAKVILASKEMTFQDWLRQRLEQWLQEESQAEQVGG